MSAHSFTNGPWSVVAVDGICEEGGVEYDVVDADNELVARVSGRENEESAHAVARVLAAGPRMLAALQLIATMCDESEAEFRKRGGTRRGLCFVATSAAIAEALGEEA